MKPNKINPKTKPVIQPKANAVTITHPGLDHKHLWFLVLFSIALYSNTLFFKYALDDALMITENSFTKKGVSGISAILSNDAFTGFFGVQKKLVAGGRYRPLSQLMFAVEYQFFGLNPFIGHLVNVLLYALCAGILYLILKKMLPAYHHPVWYRSLPLVASLLFICHPLHTEVVANIKGRDEILSLLGSLLCLHLAMIYADKKQFWVLPAIALTFFLGLMAKENAITFLAVVPLSLYYFRKVRFSDYMLIISPMIIGAFAYLYLRYLALGYLTSNVKIEEVLNDPYIHSSLSEKLATNTLTWGIYLKLLLFPHPLTHDYYPWAIKLTSWADIRVIVTLLAYLGMLYFAILGLKKKSLLSYAIFFFFITFSISSNLVFNIGTFMNERFMFVPLLGFTMILAWLITVKLPLAQGKSSGVFTGTTIIILVLCTAYSIKTFSRNFTWKDDFTLFTTDVETSVNSAKCNVSAGGMYLNRAVSPGYESQKEALLQKAEDHLRHAISIYSGNSAAWVLLGNVYLQHKDYPKAAEYYVKCLNIANKQTEALTKLRYVAYTAGREALVPPGNKEMLELGISGFKALIKLQPDSLNHYVQLADFYSRSNRADTAVLILDSVLVKHPSYADGWGKLGEMYGRVFNDMPKSLVYLEKSFEADPKNSTTLENLGICYGFMKDFPKSIDFFLKALAINPDDPRLLNNIGNSYRMMGNIPKSEEYFKKAAALPKKEQ